MFTPINDLYVDQKKKFNVVGVVAGFKNIVRSSTRKGYISAPSPASSILRRLTLD